MPAREVVLRNTAFNAAGRLWDAAASLVLVAYIVNRHIGAEGYGLWAIVGAVTGYAALLDIGVTSGYTKFIAEDAARKEWDRVSSVVSTGLAFYLSFGALFVGVCWVGAGWVAPLLPGLDSDSGELAFLIRGSVLLFAVSNCIAPFTAVQSGLQRMGVTNVISFAVSWVKIGATVLFLELGYGVRGLLYANAVVLAVFAVASVGAAFWLLPELRIGVGRASRETFARLYRFGWRAQVARLSNLVMFETDILVLAILFQDLAIVGVYRVAVELANKLRQIPAMMLSALVPAASELEALGRRKSLTRLYEASTKYVGLVAIPLNVFVAVSGTLVFLLWMGPRFEGAQAAAMFAVLAGGYAVNSIAGAGVTVMLGMGRADLQMKAGLISMTSNIALTIVLAYAIGFWGIPIATTVSMVLSWVWFAWAAGSIIGVPAGRLTANALRWTAIATVPAAIPLLAGAASLDVSSRLGAAGALAGCGMVSVFFFLFILRALPAFTDYDLDVLGQSLRLNRVPGFRAWAKPFIRGAS